MNGEAKATVACSHCCRNPATPSSAGWGVGVGVLSGVLAGVLDGDGVGVPVGVGMGVLAGAGVGVGVLVNSAAGVAVGAGVGVAPPQAASRTTMARPISMAVTSLLRPNELSLPTMPADGRTGVPFAVIASRGQ